MSTDEPVLRKRKRESSAVLVPSGLASEHEHQIEHQHKKKRKVSTTAKPTLSPLPAPPVVTKVSPSRVTLPGEPVPKKRKLAEAQEVQTTSPPQARKHHEEHHHHHHHHRKSVIQRLTPKILRRKSSVMVMTPVIDSSPSSKQNKIEVNSTPKTPSSPAPLPPRSPSGTPTRRTSRTPLTLKMVTVQTPETPNYPAPLPPGVPATPSEVNEAENANSTVQVLNSKIV